MQIKQLISAVALLGALSAAHAADAAKWTNGVLTDAAGFTLYTFDQDAKGKSNCAGGCAAAWPPATVAADAKAAGDFSIVNREDGSKQWAYQSRPLYHFAGDQKPGDAGGDNSGNVWHAVRSDKDKGKAAAPESGGGYSSSY